MLRTPARGSAQIRFSATDWDHFLVHPLLNTALKSRAQQPGERADVAFSARGGTRLRTDGGDVVEFPVRFDGVELTAALSQGSDGSVVCIAQPAGTDAAASAGPWLAGLFSNLVLDLDGCELRFRALRVEQPRPNAAPELALQLDVCVRAFPSLDINF